MAKIDLGKIKLAFEGEWDSHVTYELDDVVQWVVNCGFVHSPICPMGLKHSLRATKV